MFKIFLLVLFAVSTASASSKNCDFKTGNYISELKDPASIKLIDIEVPKSAKYAQNALKTIVSGGKNILPNLKRRFKANISVSYEFGTCNFNGTVRQNGDLKDHIRFEAGGKVVRSLDVKLKEGNILSAVRFKLLLPETRGGMNEILATQIFRNIGIISPETFATKVSVNGATTVMLFQENAEKELLERNLRRESAIYEGDEELLWSYSNFDEFELEPLALSRMTNPDWFLKGATSEKISLNGFSMLQGAYSAYAQNIGENLGLIIQPNNRTDKTFEEFAFALVAMNAGHAMTPNNRKYYFNPIYDKFEPIYYDGNALFGPLSENIIGRSRELYIQKQFPRGINENFIQRLLDTIESATLEEEFLRRSKLLVKSDKIFFQNAKVNFTNNINKLKNLVDSRTSSGVVPKSEHNFTEYMSRMKQFNLEQVVFSSLKYKQSGYEATFDNGNTINLSSNEIAKLISRNRFDGERALYLPDTTVQYRNNLQVIKTQEFQGQILASKTMEFSIDPEKRNVVFLQRKANDWATISGADISKWTFNFIGLPSKQAEPNEALQRFNQFGLTGCLTFYDSKLRNLTIDAKNGDCEDTVNIISSTGTIDSITVTTASADAVDIDFSDIQIKSLVVQSAGNDCFDVSGGSYVIKNTNLEDCGDKGISVGESSKLTTDYIKINNSNIGVASKDSSTVSIKQGYISNIAICFEAKQKKQEFGGAQINLMNVACDGKYAIDSNSLLKDYKQ